MAKRKFWNILITAVMILNVPAIFTGCEEDDGSGHTFKYNLSSNPQNLDPQLASDESSIMVIENIMSGLVKKGADGSIQPDAAKSYTISDDGLVYTFELKDDIYWESAADFTEKLTANDFVLLFSAFMTARHFFHHILTIFYV